MPHTPAGHLITVTPFAADSIEVRAQLSQAKPTSVPVTVKVNYPVKIVGVTPSICPLGDRTGLTLATLDDIDVSIESREQRYNYGERFDEGTTTAANQRISLRALVEQNRYFQMDLGGQTGTSELVLTFGFKDDAAGLLAASMAPTLVALCFAIQRLDAGSRNGG
jgi:hypothetical protein